MLRDAIGLGQFSVRDVAVGHCNNFWVGHRETVLEAVQVDPSALSHRFDRLKDNITTGTGPAVRVPRAC